MNKNIGDMTKEELYELCNELLDVDADCMLLQRKIDKAIEYIQNHQPVFKLNTKRQLKEMYDEFYKNILEILGDKENE